MFDFIENEELREKAEAEYQAQIKAVQEEIDVKVNDAVSGLKAKNEELLDEKKKIQEKLSHFDGVDPDTAIEAIRFIQENDDARLVKEGKVDELVEKRTANMRLEFEKTVNELSEKAKQNETIAETFKRKYEKKLLDDEVRDVAVKAGVRQEAINDVLMRATDLFVIGQDGSVEARDENGNLLKNQDGNVVTPLVWIESLKDTSPHYWPSSEGAGANGGNVNNSDAMEKLAMYAKNGNMKEYKKLREKMLKNK